MQHRRIIKGSPTVTACTRSKQPGQIGAGWRISEGGLQKNNGTDRPFMSLSIKKQNKKTIIRHLTDLTEQPGERTVIGTKRPSKNNKQKKIIIHPRKYKRLYKKEKVILVTTLPSTE